MERSESTLRASHSSPAMSMVPLSGVPSGSRQRITRSPVSPNMLAIKRNLCTSPLRESCDSPRGWILQLNRDTPSLFEYTFEPFFNICPPRLVKPDSILKTGIGEEFVITFFHWCGKVVHRICDNVSCDSSPVSKTSLNTRIAMKRSNRTLRASHSSPAISIVPCSSASSGLRQRTGIPRSPFQTLPRSK